MADPPNKEEHSEAFGRALLTATLAIPHLDAIHAQAVTNATSHLNEHLIPSLHGLAVLVAPLCPTATATIIYTHLPLILESLRKFAHDARGAQFEGYCAAHTVTAPEDMAMAWELVEALWEHAAMRACALALKFADALRVEKKCEEKRKARRARERAARQTGVVTVDRAMQTD